MAKRIPIGALQPTASFGLGSNQLIPHPAGSPGPVRQQTVVLGKDAVWLHSGDPYISLVARLAGYPSAALPRPRYDTVNLPGTTGLTRYRGHDPHVMTVPLLIEHGGRSVEAQIVALEELARRHPPSNEPPIVKCQGIGIKHDERQWRVTFEDEPERTIYDLAGNRIRMWVTVTLVEHLTERLLAETLTGGKAAAGTRTSRHTTTRAGDDLYAISRRVYGDPSRASDIARANPGTRLGQRFRQGVTLRLP